MSEFHRPDQPQQIVPVIGNQLGLDGLGEQRTGVRVPGAPRRPGAEAVELQSADVTDAWRELQAGQIEDRERGQRLTGGVGGVLGDRQVSRVAENLIEHRDRLAPGGRDDLGAVGRVLIGDVGVGGGALVEEVARQGAGREAATALREPLPVRGRQRPATPQPSERMPMVGVHKPGVRLPQGLLTQVPLRGPREGVFGDARGSAIPA